MYPENEQPGFVLFAMRKGESINRRANLNHTVPLFENDV